jgi:hypothetical protein
MTEQPDNLQQAAGQYDQVRYPGDLADQVLGAVEAPPPVVPERWPWRISPVGLVAAAVLIIGLWISLTPVPPIQPVQPAPINTTIATPRPKPNAADPPRMDLANAPSPRYLRPMRSKAFKHVTDVRLRLSVFKTIGFKPRKEKST